MRSAPASSALLLAACVGCNADGLLLVTVDHAAASINVGVFEDTECNAVPFAAATAVTRRSFDTSNLGDAPQVGIFVSPKWHDRAVRLEVTAEPTGYGCVCVRLPGGGDTRTVDLALSDQQPATCGTVGPGPDGGAHGDSVPGDPSAGDPSAGDPSPGDPSAGDPSAGDPSAGDPSAGDPSAGDPQPGDPNTGDPGPPVDYATENWSQAIAAVVYYGVVTPRDTSQEANLARLRYQLLQGDTCGTATDWSAPRDLCASGCDADIHAISVSGINTDGRMVVAVQQRSSPTTDALTLYEIDLTSGATTRSTVGTIDPQPIGTVVYPFKVAAILVGEDHVIVATTCAAGVTNCTVGGWILKRAETNFGSRALIRDAPLRWLRATTEGSRVGVVGIDGSDQMDGAILDVSAGTSVSLEPTAWPDAARNDRPVIDAAFTPTGGLMVFLLWRGGPSNLQLCPYHYNALGQLAAFTTCSEDFQSPLHDVTAITNSQLNNQAGPVATVARGGSPVRLVTWNLQGGSPAPLCEGDIETSSVVSTNARRTAAITAWDTVTHNWLSALPRNDARIDVRMTTQACTTTQSELLDDNAATLHDLTVVNRNGKWIAVRRDTLARGTVTRFTAPDQSETCMPQWSVPGAPADRVVPMGAAIVPD